MILSCVAALSARPEPMFPFNMPWDDASENAASVAFLNDSPAGAKGFVRAEKGHLFAGKDRLKLFGVNIVFGAAMPSHDEADRIAARLSKFGFNCVRLHHMDTRNAPDGLLERDKITVNESSLERLDYFVAALKKRGVYADLNLHVGRNYPGYTKWDGDEPQYWKGVDLFFEPMIAMQKDYARKLLTHVNRYTGTRYADEPAVAIVEINNENGILSQWRRGAFDGMSDPFVSALCARWNSWLKKKYRDDAGLERAWSVVSAPAGPEMLGGRDNVRSSEKGWNLQLIGGADADLSREGEALVLDLKRPGKDIWHMQLHQNGLSIEKDKPYTLRIEMCAEKNMKLSVVAMQGKAPWRNLWREGMKVGKDWKRYELTFSSAETESVARLTFTGFGLETGKIRIRNASLRSGGTLGLREGESLARGTIDVFESGNYLGRTVEAQRDWLRFLWDTESAYWKDMYSFVKKDLGVKCPVLGTQVSFSPATMQSQMDIVDGHAYWQHPRYPGKPWDEGNWDIVNTPMAGIENGGTLPDLALRRVPGKPFIVTEYNHPAPSYYQAEALPLAAAYASLQDWDGIFLYSYGVHKKIWDPGYVNNFFDSTANPVKMTSAVSAALLFRRGDVSPAKADIRAVPTEDVFIEQIRNGRPMPSSEFSGAQRSLAFTGYASIASPAGAPGKMPYLSETGELAWGDNGGRTVTIDTSRSKAVIGALRGYSFDAHGVTFDFRNGNDWSVVAAHLVKGNSFSSNATVLITALSKEENTDQKWTDDKKKSVGKNWGKAPVLVEGVEAVIRIPASRAKVKAWILDERGNRVREIPVKGDSSAEIGIASSYHTLWYEVEIR
jgi:hypothetical protein